MNAPFPLPLLSHKGRRELELTIYMLAEVSLCLSFEGGLGECGDNGSYWGDQGRGEGKGGEEGRKGGAYQPPGNPRE